MSNVENFKASFSEMARPNRFRIMGFGVPSSLTYMAKAASLPAATLGVTEAWYAGRAVKLAGDRVYPDWTLTVYQSVDSDVYDSFQRWQEDTLSHIPNVGSNYHETYKRDGEVYLLDRQGLYVSKYSLHGAVITELGAIELASDTNDTPAEFTVTLAYDYFLYS